MYITTIDTALCQGDGDCVEVCPVTILSIVDGKSQVTGDQNDCLGCESCVAACSHSAIAVSEM